MVISTAVASTYETSAVIRRRRRGRSRLAARAIEVARPPPYPRSWMPAQPGSVSGSHAARLQAGVQLGDYVLGQPLWPLRIADAYRANGPSGASTVYVIHAPIAANPGVRDQIVAGTRAAAALPE